MMGFWFNWVASMVVTWPSLFIGHRFKLESEDFTFHILQRNFSGFGEKILVRCSAELLFFLILFSAGVYLLKVWLKCSQNRYIFFLFLFSSGIYLLKLIKTTGSFSKASIFFPGGCILLAKVIITCQSKEKTIN